MSPLSPRDADSAWLATLTILYVEDDEITRGLLARFLRRRVGRVVEAADGAEGIARFREERPAIVITDIQMPKMDGLAMAEEVRREGGTVPIVVTTAFEQIGYLERSIDVGVDKYVTKPVDTDKLEAALLVCARRHRAETLLASEQRRALDAARAHEREALGLLAGGMAHDFNNVIQSVLGNVDLAVPLSAPGTELRELLDCALESAQQAVELGRRLLTLSEGLPIQRQAGFVQPTLRAALAGALAGGSVDLRLDLPADLPPVPHDEVLLDRAFGQLAQNAREAMVDRGVLTVTGRVRAVREVESPVLAGGKYLELTFQDSGHGIAPDVLPKVFDPYFTTKPRGSIRGMGLGLSLCRAILHRHGGDVTAAARPGQGALFTVLLPIAGDDE